MIHALRVTACDGRAYARDAGHRQKKAERYRRAPLLAPLLAKVAGQS
ncbi:MAG: hypothetical protein V5B44_11455 [Candidatus Accumulibacter necessarius]